MLKKKFYTREEVEKLYLRYSNMVKGDKSNVEYINAKISSSDLSNSKTVDEICKLSEGLSKNLERSELLLSAVFEIAENLIANEFCRTFNSGVLENFTGKSCTKKNLEKIHEFIGKKYGVECVYFSYCQIHYEWNGHDMSVYTKEHLIDDSNKFLKNIGFLYSQQKQFPENLEEWARIFLAKKEEHAKLLKELENQIISDNDELRILGVQLPHIASDALRL